MKKSKLKALWKKKSKIESIKSLIKSQVNLAKRHQIYGFGIYFKLINNYCYPNLAMNIFLNEFDFPFLIILNNNEIININNNTFNELFGNIEKNILSKNYIKIKNRRILSINNKYITNY